MSPVWCTRAVRSVDMITDYVASLDGPLMPECDNNRKIVGTALDDPRSLIFPAQNSDRQWLASYTNF